MIDDATKLVSTCEAYQRFSHKTKASTQPVHVTNSSVVASAKMGHQYCWKVDSSSRQLYLHSDRS
jgi:hypothetical protein